MLLGILLIVTIIPFLYTWWRFAGWYAWHNAQENPKHRNNYVKNWRPSVDIWWGGYFVGFFVALVWPVFVVFLLTAKIHKSHGLSYTPKEIKERDRILRLEELEREVGIK